MHIESITIKNLLSFKDAKFNFKKYNVIVGPNNAGKTNLVRILQALVYRDMEDFDSIREMKHADGGKSQIRLAVETTDEETRMLMQALIDKDIGQEVDLSTWKNFTIGLGSGLLDTNDRARPLIVYFQNHMVVSAQFGKHFVSHYDPPDMPNFEQRLDVMCDLNGAQIRKIVHEDNQVPMGNVDIKKLITDGSSRFFSNNEHRGILGGPIELNASNPEPHKLELAKYVGIDSQQRQFSLTRVISRIMENSLFQSNEMHPASSTLTRNLHRLKNTDELAYRHLQKSFASIFPDTEIRVEQKDPHKDDQLVTRITERQRTFELANSASGYLEAIHILHTILNRTQRTIFLDEPEIHFHPAKIRQISRMLSKLAKESGNQITAITHSPKFLDHGLLDPDSQLMLTMVTKVDGESLVVSPKDLDANLKPHMFIPDVFFSSAVFLVEGARDEFVIRAVFDKFDEIFGEYEIAIVDCGGYGGIKPYVDFLGAYSIKYYGMADKEYGHDDAITVLAVDLEDELRKIKTVPFQVDTHQPKKCAVEDYYPYVTKLLETEEGFDELMQTKIGVSIKSVMDGFGVDMVVFKEKYKA